MKFLTAEWRKLAIFNFEIDPDLLKSYVPKGTELDFFNGKCLVSVVGFLFLNTKVLGISVPFHRNFEEVNLRFYVKKWENGIWKRGVVFIQEIVPKHALTFVANTFYNEHYHTFPMKHTIENKIENQLNIEYAWKNKDWNFLKISADAQPKTMLPNSEFEFITEHYFGFTKNGNSTTEYEVRHPKWTYYEVLDFQLNIDFEQQYGKEFAMLQHQKPDSVMLAEGSEIEVHTKKKI